MSVSHDEFKEGLKVNVYNHLKTICSEIHPSYYMHITPPQYVVLDFSLRTSITRHNYVAIRRSLTNKHDCRL
jgi:hypothetical protein